MDYALCFSRNRCTSVEKVGEDLIKSTCRLQDTVNDALVEVLVKLPDLEITDVKGRVNRSPFQTGPDTLKGLEKVVGVRIGPGVLKIIRGLVGDSTNYRQLAFMVEECCQGVILSFTKLELEKAPEDEAAMKEYYADMVRKNIRLYNRCAAFAPGSSLVDGIDGSGS